jgi:hypothetical protein
MLSQESIGKNQSEQNRLLRIFFPDRNELSCLEKQVPYFGDPHCFYGQKARRFENVDENNTGRARPPVEITPAVRFSQECLIESESTVDFNSHR